MTVLLLGSTGMAGTSFKNALNAKGISVLGVARSCSDFNCDLTDEFQLSNVLRLKNYDAIINCAALVNVDYCEKNSIESWKINAKLVSLLANWCQKSEVPLLHISTDYFYNYGDNIPHKEEDPIFCVNEYSRHKYAAEAFALTFKKSLVIRTSIVSSREPKKSLVKWAIDSLQRGEPIELFYDAWTSSIDVDTFVELALCLFFHIGHRGVINLAAGEVYSKEQLILRLAEKLSIKHRRCISTSIKKNFFNRPNCLGLDVTKAEKLLNKKMPSLTDVCDSLVSQLKIQDKSKIK